MSEGFDPYYRWLGIPLKDQPPDHYRLLGVERFEEHPDVIANAADRQMSHVKAHATGQYAAFSQKLLNELSAARVCLLNPDQRAKYNDKLVTRTRAARYGASPRRVPMPIGSGTQVDDSELAVDDFLASRRAPVVRRQRRNRIVPFAIATAAVAALLVIYIATRSVPEAALAGDRQLPDLTKEESTGIWQVPLAAPNPPPPSNQDLRESQPSIVEDKAAIESEPPQSVGLTIEGDGGAVDVDADVPTDSVAIAAEATKVKQRELPDEEGLKKARIVVAELVAGTSENAPPAELLALSQKLLSLADQSNEDPAAEVALLEAAKAQAIGADDMVVAMGVVDRLGAKYSIDVLASKADVLEQGLRRNRRGHEAQLSMARLALIALFVCDKALDDDAFSQAMRLAQTAQHAAKFVKSPELIRRATAKSRQIKSIEVALAECQQAQQVLAGNPDDAAANLTVGKYQCLTRHRWSTGLPNFVKSGSETLRAAAAMDLSAPTQAVDRLKCGDQWWELASKATDHERVSIRLRAGYWYQQAVGELNGLDRARAEKRIAELGTVSQIESLDLLETARLTNGFPNGQFGADRKILRIPGNKTTVLLPVSLPPQYELAVNVRKRILAEGGLFSINVLTGKEVISVPIYSAKSRNRMVRRCKIKIGEQRSETIELVAFGSDQAHEVKIMVERSRVRVSIDGNQVLAMDSQVDLTPTSSADYDLPHRVDLFVDGEPAEFERIEVVPVP